MTNDQHTDSVAIYRGNGFATEAYTGREIYIEVWENGQHGCTHLFKVEWSRTKPAPIEPEIEQPEHAADAPVKRLHQVSMLLVAGVLMLGISAGLQALFSWLRW